MPWIEGDLLQQLAYLVLYLHRPSCTTMARSSKSRTARVLPHKPHFDVGDIFFFFTELRKLLRERMGVLDRPGDV